MKKELIHEIIRGVIIVTTLSLTMANCSENRFLNRENKDLLGDINLVKKALTKSDILISLYSKENDSLKRLVRQKHLIIIIEKNYVNDGKR